MQKMKTKAIFATAIVMSTVALMATTSFGAKKLKTASSSGKYDGKDIAITATTKGSANGLLIEISAKKSMKSPIVKITSKLSSMSSGIRSDNLEGEQGGIGSKGAYTMSARYARTGNWPGVVSGYWSSGKGISEASLYGNFNNSKSDFSVVIRASKKLKKGKNYYLRVTPINGRRLGQKGKVVKLKYKKAATQLSVGYSVNIGGTGYSVGYSRNASSSNGSGSAVNLAHGGSWGVSSGSGVNSGYSESHTSGYSGSLGSGGGYSYSTGSNSSTSVSWGISKSN